MTAGEVETTQTRVKALTEAYTALHPNVTFELETLPGGTEGDNLVKTRLATGEMTDIFWYNSGSLLQALNPEQSLVDLSGEPFIANLDESFLPTVSAGDAIFGVPYETAMGGGILYNKKIFEENGLSVPNVLGRVRGQQREAQGGRHRPGRCDLGRDRHMDVAAVRPCRLLQRADGGARTSPRSTPPTRPTTRHARRPEGLRPPAGGLREGLVAGGLRRGDVR